LLDGRTKPRMCAGRSVLRPYGENSFVLSATSTPVPYN
jgi:hypothetical protein